MCHPPVIRWCGFAALLVVVAILLSPLRAVAGTIPVLFAYDPAIRPTATTRVETGPSLGPWLDGASGYVYDDRSRRARRGTKSRAADGTGAVHAYDAALALLERCELAEAVIYDAAAATAAAEGGGAIISEGKFGYLFGEASGNAHNVERALENASQLSRVGVYNNAEGQALLQGHFDAVVGDSSNIIRSTSNQYGNFVTRESLFAGPGGFIKFESTWQAMEGGGSRFITAIPFGGP